VNIWNILRWYYWISSWRCYYNEEYKVVGDPLKQTVVCRCKQFDRIAILCGHALKVLDLVTIKSLPPQYVLKWWTQEAHSWIIQDNKGRNMVKISRIQNMVKISRICWETVLSISTHNTHRAQQRYQSLGEWGLFLYFSCVMCSILVYIYNYTRRGLSHSSYRQGVCPVRVHLETFDLSHWLCSHPLHDSCTWVSAWSVLWPHDSPTSNFSQQDPQWCQVLWWAHL
jgi:hypothetical protein